MSSVGHIPQRQCALTRAKGPRHTLLRLALSPDGTPYLDLLGRAPGRGVYVTCDRDLALEALSEKGARRVFKGKARPLAPDEAMRHVEDAVRRLDERQLELIGIARRSGDLELGMDAVLRLVGTGESITVAMATDASDRTRRKVDESLDGRDDVRRIELANDKATVGARLGRGEVAVVALKASKLADRLATEFERRSKLAGMGTRTGVMQ